MPCLGIVQGSPSPSITTVVFLESMEEQRKEAVDDGTQKKKMEC